MEQEDPDSVDSSWDHFPQESFLHVIMLLLQALDPPKEYYDNNESN